MAEMFTAIVPIGQAGSQPGLGLLAGFTKNPAANRQNQSTVFRYGNKLSGRDRSSSGMSPTEQGFCAGDLSRFEVDLRLVVHHKFLPFESPPQALLNGLPLDGADVHGRLEELIRLPAIFLCLVHGGVRILDQGFGIHAVIGVKTDANAAGDVKIVFIDEMSFGDRPQHSVGQ